MPSAALLLEEAFGKHMLVGAAEWRDVPDVVRSSLYVLQKVLRHLDARLSRCETDKSAASLLSMLQTSMRQVEADCHRVVTDAVAAATAPLQASALTAHIDQLQAHAREADDLYKHKLHELGRRAATHAGSLAHYDMLEKLEMRCKSLERQFAAALHGMHERPVAPTTSDAKDEAPTDRKQRPSTELGMSSMSHRHDC
ncbi:hypothetical protein SPRG_02076 [Saprolegnia parasitica CBS 223.65]|uniref:Uncharacterized protein n=1 Tax=Saprolegnia parasitica (strain CBS 223.65) TaxID=695850 RepID=A0A067D2M0_SAPPC|nr:hypothetical protein SPRG_02076 [Saprolegnia parasitica CBS 223.65]KDO33267.1 hypothetical protein SPRG_02076 [Saprolegnia parasitica CBS 223.65]|eukprot:XP_012196023.1 hypothetical protein SPRG_02076 [Saprolegnia parasitica CBS 223.65]